MMAMKTRPTIKLPPIPPQIDNEEVRKYLKRVDVAIRHFVKGVYDDVTNGRIRHRLYTTTPTTSDVEEGEVVFYQSGSTRRLYANVAGTIKYITMT